MPKKDLSGGFTKAAQRQKFVRHRDIKMKQSELEREARTQKLMCEGVCARFREKVQWRFKYDKYKPLKNVATCQSCKQKCVTKAYRAYCDDCSRRRNVCSSCCRDLDEVRREEEERTKARGVAEGQNGGGGEQGVSMESMEEDGEDSLVEEEMGREAELKEEEGEPGESPWPEENDDFLKLAAMKYSKKRVVGSAEDLELATKFATYTS